MTKALLYIPLLIFLASCESEVDGPAWPDHDPKLVVTANIRVEGDSVQVFCRVSRTMALNEEFRIDRAMVNDAVVEIHHDGGIHQIPFRAGYYPYDFDVNYTGFVPRGSTGRFELVVRKDAMTARSVLEVPMDLPMRFDTLLLVKYNERTYRADFAFQLSTPIQRVSYAMDFERLHPKIGWQPYGGLPSRIIRESHGRVSTGTFDYGIEKDYLYRYILTARGPQYNAYEDSRWWSGYSGSPFEPEEQNPPFNVGGEGIGFFWWELVGEPVEFSY